MKYLLGVLMALVIGATTVSAHPGHTPQKPHPNHRPGNNHHHKPSPPRPGKDHHKHYHKIHGHKFKHGWYFKGRHHNHWTHKHYCPTRRCWLFYDGGCRSWYYYCVPARCFYPVCYCPYNTFHWKNDNFCHPNGCR